MARKRVAVLISGRGSNMVALIEAAKDPAYPAEIVLVLSNDPAAQGLAHARASGIATAAVDHRPFVSRESHARAFRARLKPFAGQQHAGLGQLLVVLPHLSQKLLIRQHSGFRVLVGLDQHHESHRL